MTWPEKYLENLPIEKESDPRPANAIMLSHLRRSLGRREQLLAVSMLIIEVNDFFNVRGNMNQKQIKLTAELILDDDNLYDLTLGNIKACFRQRMKTEKLYDRLDGNIIISWLRDFKAEMADHCEIVREGEDAIRRREESQTDTGAITHATYLAMLEARANSGDQDARKILAQIQTRAKSPTPDDQERKRREFMKYKAEYLMRKQKERQDANKSN